MTYEDAYAEGFCKAAEVIGVDPAALVKRAQVKKMIGELAGRAVSAGKRLKDGAGNVGGRYLELLRGGNSATLDTGRALRDNTLLNRMLVRAKRTIGRNTSPEIKNELRKALAVQAGTGLAAGGALAGTGYALAPEDKPKTTYEKLRAALGLA